MQQIGESLSLNFFILVLLGFCPLNGINFDIGALLQPLNTLECCFNWFKSRSTLLLVSFICCFRHLAEMVVVWICSVCLSFWCNNFSALIVVLVCLRDPSYWVLGRLEHLRYWYQSCFLPQLGVFLFSHGFGSIIPCSS